MRQIDDRNRARSGQVRGGGSRARDKWQEAVEHAVEHSSGVEIFVAFPNHFPVSNWLSFLRLSSQAPSICLEGTLDMSSQEIWSPQNARSETS